MNDRPEDALKVLIKLHSGGSSTDHTFAENEYRILKAQIDFESQSRTTILDMMRRPPLRKRLIIGFITMFATQCIGTLVILGQQPAS